MNTRGNPTRTAALIVAAVLVFSAVLGGGTWLVLRGTVFRPVALPDPPKELPSPWPEPGAEAVRAVPMPTGEMAAALPDYTAPHVLCSALPEQSWAKLLGGPVLREVSAAFGCTVVTTTLRVRAELSDGKPAASTGTPERTSVGGRDATIHRSSDRRATAVVRLLGTSAPSWAKPVLEISLEQDVWDRAPRDLPTMVRDGGEGIVNAVTTPGPSLPADSAETAMPAREAGPVPGSGIVDAAGPMIAWQLCSALSRSTGRPLEEFVPKHDGECEYRRDKEFGSRPPAAPVSRRPYRTPSAAGRPSCRTRR